MLFLTVRFKARLLQSRGVAELIGSRYQSILLSLITAEISSRIRSKWACSHDCLYVIRMTDCAIVCPLTGTADGGQGEMPWAVS